MPIPDEGRGPALADRDVLADADANIAGRELGWEADC